MSDKEKANFRRTLDGQADAADATKGGGSAAKDEASKTGPTRDIGKVLGD